MTVKAKPTFEEKMAKALKNGKKFVKVTNAGAFKELSVYFRVIQKGVSEHYCLSVVHSHASFSLFGYGSKQNHANLFKKSNEKFKHVPLLESVDFSKEIEDLHDEIEKSFTDDELAQTIQKYTGLSDMFGDSLELAA